MIFNTWVYAIFTFITFVVYWFLVSKKYRAHVLLFASYTFFTYHFPFHTFLILCMTIVVYCLSLFIFRYKQLYDQGSVLAWYQNPKIYLVAIILFCLSILAFYKYLKMAIATLNQILNIIDFETTFTVPSLIVPLGISFFVFEFIHYAVDVYQGKAQKTGPFQFAVFIMYFPTLVSGPIKRYQSFNDQTLQMGSFKASFLYEGLYRILIGLFKKIVIADHMTEYANYLLSPSTSTTSQLFLGMYAYSIKIYFDFSGYSDIAIGSAKLFGYKMPENFNYPYFQRNLSSFWNNWHMSLSSWIRDYIYIPLGGNRGSLALAARNSIIAMGISGLWHGAGWHFVIWGLYHGFGLAFLRFYTLWKKRWGNHFALLNEEKPDLSDNISKHGKFFSQIRNGISIIVTYHFVAFGWIFFYCDLNTSMKVIGKMIRGVFY